jgi:hypothetical protein
MKLVVTEPVKKEMDPVIYGHQLVQASLHLATDVHFQTRVGIYTETRPI